MDDIKILISALIHDLGKALERTKEYKTKEFPSDIKEYNTYSHSKHSAFFIRTLRTKVDKVSDFVKYNFSEEVEQLVLMHHNPYNEYGQIIQIADWLASSEREEKDAEEADAVKYYVDVRLMAPFKWVDEDAEELYYQLSSLKNIKPKKKSEIIIEDYDYSRLVDQLLNKIAQIDDFEQLLTLYEYYLSQVPAQTVGYSSDISLYDHCRITAALAHALFRNFSEGRITKSDLQLIKNGLKDKDYSNEVFNKKLFTLVLGDLSGIQSFLFNVTSEKAGRMLKGKSVFLDLLTRYAAKYLLDSTGYTRVNTIYLGGGNFELLTAYISDDNLDKLRGYIIENLWKLLGEDLYLGIEWLHLSLYDLFNFIESKEILIQKINDRKKKRFSELKCFYDLILKPRNEAITEGGYCTICGKKKYKDASINERWCKSCNSFVELAYKIDSVKFLVEYKANLEKDPETVTEYFEKLGYNIEFTRNLKEKPKGSKVYILEEVSIEDDIVPYGFLLGSYNLAESDFDIIAKSNITNGYGDKKLAYLKMDADNMGKVFTKLVKRESDKAKNKERSVSLTRYGVLSRRIELFFGKEVFELIKGDKQVYPIFIGGDDLFIIGNYKRINKLVLEIKERYRLYTGSNKLFTISAGLCYLNHDFPLIRAANLVEESLDKAKTFKYQEEIEASKNKICVETEVLSYKEFEEAVHISNDLAERILSSEKESSRGVIFKIESSLKDYSPLLEMSLKRKIKPPLIWRFMYYLREHKQIAEKLAKILLQNVFDNGIKLRNPRLILVATKIAKMQTRKEG